MQALPTVTPQGKIAIGVLQRQLVSVEKLLVHGFPVQEMVFPEKVTDAHIESLGGNTMHLKCVGLAMLMLALIPI